MHKTKQKNWKKIKIATISKEKKQKKWKVYNFPKTKSKKN